MIIFKDQLTEQLTRTGQAENLLKKKENKTWHAKTPWKYPRDWNN